MDDSSTVVREDREYEQQPERDRRHDEEVGGHQRLRVISETKAILRLKAHLSGAARAGRDIKKARRSGPFSS